MHVPLVVIMLVTSEYCHNLMNACHIIFAAIIDSTSFKTCATLSDLYLFLQGHMATTLPAIIFDVV